MIIDSLWGGRRQKRIFDDFSRPITTVCFGSIRFKLGHPIDHGINIHPGADRSKDNDIARIQTVIVQLTLYDEIEQGRQGGDRTVSGPGDHHGHDTGRNFVDLVKLEQPL